MTRTATARWSPALATVLLTLAVSRPGPGRRLRPQRPAAPPEALPALPRREEAEGGLNLAKFADEESLRGDPDSGSRCVDALTERSMPPPGNKAGPNEDERQRAADLDPGRPRRHRGGERPRPQPDPAADPPAVQQHDPRPARRRRPAGRRLPRRRRRRRRVRQQRRDPVRPADPHGEVPGGGGRRARRGRPGALPRRPPRPRTSPRRRPPGAASPRSPAAPSAARSTTPRSTA